LPTYHTYRGIAAKLHLHSLQKCRHKGRGNSCCVPETLY
jgi:hypothetical protein